MSVQQTVWNFLRSKGMSEKSAAAIMGNIEAESEFDETLVEKGNGIGFGLCQWSFERRTQLERFGTSVQKQLEFMWSELSGKNLNSTGATFQWINKSQYLKHEDFMSGNGSISDLTKSMCFCWERPNEQLCNINRRQKKAQEYFDKFTGSAAAGTNNDAADTKENKDSLNIESTSYSVIKGSEKEGDILFGRRWRITVGDKQGNSIDISQLHCIFAITKTIQMETNISEIVVYNLNVQTENFILINGARVTIEAGYEGSNFGLIFDGDILQTIREKENANTFKLTITALDSDRPVNFDIVNFSIARGQTARGIVEHIATAGNPIELGSISEKLDKQRLTRGKVLFGKSSDYLRQIAKSYELHYYMDDGSLNLISLSDLPVDEIIELSTESGLIGTPEQNDYGISGECLLNPQIKLNSLIHIDNSLVRLKKMDTGGTAGATVGITPGSSTAVSSNTRDIIINEAKRICDDPKVQYSQDYRGKTINGITYWDCSSFAKHCYEMAGIQIVDITYNQYAMIESKGQFVSEADALPGDLVFWGEGPACHHIAIYAGDGCVYAARGQDGKAPRDQVAYHKLYGTYKIGRLNSLAGIAKQTMPSTKDEKNNDEDCAQSLIRALDKDGIYRVIKLEYAGDTRGNDWYIKFETIDQLGGVIPTVAN